MVQQLFHKATSEHQDLIGAYVSSGLAAIIIRYVAGVGHPSIVHVALALVAVLGFLTAFLLIAQSNVEPEVKAGNIVGAAVISGICFGVVSYFV